MEIETNREQLEIMHEIVVTANRKTIKQTWKTNLENRGNHVSLHLAKGRTSKENF